ncbi:hypothetical protein PsSCT_33850 [Pseudomonas sp. SCT]
MEVASALDELFRLRWVFSEGMLVLTVRAMVFASKGASYFGCLSLRLRAGLGQAPIEFAFD